VGGSGRGWGAVEVEAGYRLKVWASRVPTRTRVAQHMMQLQGGSGMLHCQAHMQATYGLQESAANQCSAGSCEHL
jgi:hypothetical protein